MKKTCSHHLRGEKPVEVRAVEEFYELTKTVGLVGFGFRG